MKMIVAHRGAPHVAHENTIDSFIAAVKLGADMVELDIRRTADNKLVIFHDPCIIEDGRKKTIAELTFAELQKIAAKQRFTIPTVAETFKTLSGNIKLDIELKEQHSEAEVVALANRYFDYGSYVMTSFDPCIIKAIKNIDSKVATGLILANAQGLPLCDAIPVDVLAPRKTLFTSHRNFFKKAHTRGKKIAVWTVDGTALMNRLLQDPIVEALITNHPERAIKLRGKKI